MSLDRTGAVNGNVYAITNNRATNRSQTFTYDCLNRLISAQNAGTDCNQKLPDGHTENWGNSYVYDPWGNLNQKVVTKCAAENMSVAVNASNQLQGYSYDAAGNMTVDNSGTSYVYDAENRIGSTSGFSYVYDADGNRVQKTNSNITPATGTLYWYMSPGIVAESDLSGNLQSEYVFFDGQRVARRDFPGNAVSYYFSDHLKTASVITDAVGNLKSESDYYPWGGELQFLNGDSNHYKFTGKERDAETGLDYFGARHYSNGLGRFITPDWSATPVPIPYADLDDPQSLNQYSYVRNIPTVKIDLDGHGCPPVCDLPTPTAEDWKLIEQAGKGGAGVSLSAILTGAAIVFVPVMVKPDILPGGTASTDWPKDENGNYVNFNTQGKGQTPQLGQARGADEEKSQSDNAKEKERTNGGHAQGEDFSRSAKKEIDERDGNKCQNCGSPIRSLQNKKGVPTPPDQRQRHYE